MLKFLRSGLQRPMTSPTYVNYDQPFDSVIADLGKLEKSACSGMSLMPVLGAFLVALPAAGFVVIFQDPDAPLFAYAIVSVILLVVAGVEFYFVQNLRRHRLARAALRAWALARGWTEQGRAYVGLAEGRRCAVTTLYRSRGRNDYVLDGLAFVVQLTDYSAASAHMVERLGSQQQVLQGLDAGLSSMLVKYSE